MAGKLGQLNNNQVSDLSVVKNEQSVSKHINILSHIDDYTLIDKDSQLIRIFKLDGINSSKLDDLERCKFKNERNDFYKDMSNEIALYFWSVRRPFNVELTGEFEQGTYAEKFNCDYQAQLNKSNFFKTEYYIAAVTKAADGALATAGLGIKKFFLKANANAHEKYIAKQQLILEEFSNNLLADFDDYRIRKLGIVQKQGRVVSEPLSFIDYLLNHTYFDVPRILYSADNLLMRSKPFFNKKNGIITLREINGKTRYASCLSIKSYCSETFAGMMDSLHDLCLEFVVTQSYSPYYKDIAKKKLKSTQKEMAQSEDESVIQTQELSESMEDIARLENGLGIHHLTITVYANSEVELNDNITKIKERIDVSGLVLTKEDVGSEIAFWAQLPGNFSYIARGANITTKNLASFISFHNAAVGKRSNNHWGEYLTVFETRYRTPYYFNIHAESVGLGLIYGAQGSGKTVLAGSLILQSMKFGGRRIIFDKDYGLKIMVLVAGGTYFDLDVNKPSGFNPLHLPDSSDNRSFLCNLLEKMLTIYGNSLDEHDSKKIKQVVDSVYTNLDYQQRQMCHLAPYFGTPGQSVLRNKFDEWHTNGRYAWVFDNEKDELNLDKDIIGFDMTKVIKAKDIKTPIFMYLLHRADLSLKGKRGGIVIDEAWNILNDEYLAEHFIKDRAKVTRKKDDFMILMTQEPEDAVTNTIVSDSLKNSSSFEIFYPNYKAKEDTYCKQLGLTEHEFELVKTLKQQDRCFLLKHKQGQTSEIVRMNLTGMTDALNIISGKESTVKILNEIIQANPNITSTELASVFLKQVEECNEI